MTRLMATAVAGAALDDPARRRRGQVYVGLAAVAWSTAGVLQRQLSLDVATQVGGRALFAALALLAYVALVERGGVVRAFRSIGLAGLGLAVAMAVASGSFIVALNHTTVAHVLFTQGISPVLAALLARVLLGEPISRRTAVAMTVAIGGVALMMGAPGHGSLLGDGLSLVMAIAFALVIVITRHRNDVSMAPATCLSQALLLAVCLPFADPDGVGGGDALTLALMGAGQIGLGLVLLTIGGRLIPAAQIALITLLEVVLGPLWVWLALDERPETTTLVGGAVVIAAILIQARGRPAAAADVREGAGRIPPPP